MRKNHAHALAMLCYPRRSGVTHYTHNLCRELAAYFPDLYVLLNRAADVDKRDAKYRNVAMFSRTRWLWLDVCRLFAFVVRRRIRYVHFQSAIKSWAVDLPVLLALKAAGRKIIYTAHDVLPHTRKKYEVDIIRRIYRLFDLIIVHSEHSRDVVASMEVAPEKIRVIPHGLYTMFVPPRAISAAEARNELGVPLDNKVLLFFGSINPRKGAEKLVAGMDKLVARQKNITLVMAGNVDYPDGYLQTVAKAHGVDQHVKIFRGWVPNDRVHVFFTAADMVILPYNEGFTSGVLKLAYAFKKPVVASGVGELAGVLESEKTGIVIDEIFSKESAARVLELLNSERQLGIYRENIGKIAEDKYSWKAIAKKTAAAYAEAFAELAPERE